MIFILAKQGMVEWLESSEYAIVCFVDQTSLDVNIVLHSVDLQVDFFLEIAVYALQKYVHIKSPIPTLALHAIR